MKLGVTHNTLVGAEFARRRALHRAQALRETPPPKPKSRRSQLQAAAELLAAESGLPVKDVYEALAGGRSREDIMSC